MFRVKIILLVAAAGLLYWGFQEWRVSSGASAEPEAVQLAEIEAGKTFDNNHVKFGPHVAVYGASVYEYSQSKYDRSSPNDSTRVSHCFYPVLAATHPFVTAIDALEEQYPEGIPDEVEFPDISNFAVLVKTKRFSTIGSIPDGLAEEDAVQGLVINRISSLDKDEKRLINENFPGVDTHKLWILGEGRKPASIVFSFGILGAGALLGLLGLGWIVAGFASS